jgi:hypothetical protein
MQNPAFWAYLKGLWCLKINIFFLLCFVDYIQFKIWNYTQFVQYWKIYRVNSLIWYTLNQLNVLWTDHGFLRVAKWTQIQNYKPFHQISRWILHRGHKTSFHFSSLHTEICLIISIETNGSFFLNHNCSLFVFCHHLISIYI